MYKMQTSIAFLCFYFKKISVPISSQSLLYFYKSKQKYWCIKCKLNFLLQQQNELEYYTYLVDMKSMLSAEAEDLSKKKEIELVHNPNI